MATGIEVTPVSMAVSCAARHDAPVSYAVINSAAGDSTVVPATVGKKIRVLNYFFIVKTTAVDITWQSGTGGTALTGAMTPNAGVPTPPCYDPNGHFETASGALLNLHQSGTSQISGYVSYQLVDGTND